MTPFSVYSDHFELEKYYWCHDKSEMLFDFIIDS